MSSTNYKLKVDELIPYLPTPREYIEDYVGLELSRVGTACCPFHEDKNHSFSVSTKGFIKCFAGCFAGKNAVGILNFHKKHYHSAVDSKTAFKNTLYDLANAYASHLVPTDSDYKPSYVKIAPKTNTKRKNKVENTPKISENRKIELFASVLAYSKGKLSYLAKEWLTSAKRGLTMETINHFQLFSIDTQEEFWQYITYLKGIFTKEEIKATGIYSFLKFVNYGLPFVVIPYFDIENRCTFLQARALIHIDKENGIFCAVNGDLLVSSEQLAKDRENLNKGKKNGNSGYVPKYLNTRIGEGNFVPLFNAVALNEPKGTPKNREETVTIFEGAFDCMLAYQVSEKMRCVANTSASNIQALLQHKNELEPFFIVYAGDCDKAGEQRYIQADEKDGSKLDKRCIAANFEIGTQLKGRFVYLDPLADGYENFAQSLSYAANDFTEAVMSGIAPTFEPIGENGTHRSILNVRKVLRTTEIHAAAQVCDLETSQTVDYQQVISENKRFVSDAIFSKNKTIPAAKKLTAEHYTRSVLLETEKVEKTLEKNAQLAVYHTIIVDWFTVSVKIQNSNFFHLHEIGKEEALAAEQFSWVHKIDNFIKLEFLNGGTQQFSLRVNVWFQNELFARGVYKPIGILAKTNPLLMQLTVENCFLYSCDWTNKLTYIMQVLQLEYANVSRLDIAIDSLDSLNIHNENSIVGFCNAYLQQFHKNTRAAHLAAHNFNNAKQDYADLFGKKPSKFSTTDRKIESLYFELYDSIADAKILSKKNAKLFDTLADTYLFLKKENRKSLAKRRKEQIKIAEKKIKKFRPLFYKTLDKAAKKSTRPAVLEIAANIKKVKDLQKCWLRFDETQPNIQMLGGNKMYYGPYKFDAERGYHEGVNVGGGVGKRSIKTMKAYLKLREMRKESPHKMRYIPKFWEQNGLKWNAEGEQEVHRLEISLRLPAIKSFGNIKVENENGELKTENAFDWKRLNDASYLASLFRTQCEKFFEFVKYNRADSNKSRWERIPVIAWDSLQGLLLPKVKRECPATIERALRTVKFLTREFIMYNCKDVLPVIRNTINRYDLTDYIEKRKNRWKSEFIKEAYLYGMLDYNETQNEMVSLNSTGGLIDPKRKHHLQKVSRAVDAEAYYLVGTDIGKNDGDIKMEYWCPKTEMFYMRTLSNVLLNDMKQSELMPYSDPKMRHNEKIKHGLLEKLADKEALDLVALEKMVLSQPAEWTSDKHGQTTLEEQIYFLRFEAKAMPKRPAEPADNSVDFEQLSMSDAEMVNLNPNDKEFDIKF